MNDLVPQDPAEAAFEALRGEVALLRRAVASLAAAPDPVDYTPAFKAVADDLADLSDRFAELVAQPRMKREEFLAIAAETAAANLREPREAIWRAQAAMTEMTRQLGEAVAMLGPDGLGRRRVQLAFVGGGLAAWLGWVALSGPVARLAPGSWAWPERMAAAAIALPMWDAGMALQRRADEGRWRSERQRVAWASENEEALAACARRAEARKRPVTCEVEVSPLSTSAAEPRH